ncbi:uncharacterized protein ColSpa_04803 [Colletotrichum spaethianum]|uniref:F-box domain-containing protein n=1 Tax=Colletotrichum spaethianum TaxID=700344 RepID=A0AA37LID1_9PEZI|nr:uncharacterized protein ColSpa_04803 [Colletotrichum spaethianum]GKT44622.1 hypothetical protein ColSpa_04803 [Colletotrichum spaethianum]
MTPLAEGQMTSERKHNSTDVDEHFVTECFSRLTRDDGLPDVPLRQANLRNLVNSISPWELIYLKLLIRNTTAKLADMPDLPEEIVATISTKLDYRDALNCTQVSKGWRRAWTADLVIKDVARAHFPGLVESHPEASPWSLLQPVAAKATARAQGKYIASLSMTTAGSSLADCTPLKLDDRSLEHAKYNPSPAEPSAALDNHAYYRQSYYGHAYCDGRIAWQWDAFSFFIDDIRAMTRTLASPSDLVIKGERDFVVSGLSKKLLVLANSRTERALIVYHLEKNQYRRVTLPSRMHEINLHNETFVVTFNKSRANADPHVWRWGGGLAKLKAPDFPETTKDLDGLFFEHLPLDITREVRFIFHPANDNFVYLVTAFFVLLVHKALGSSSEQESDVSDTEHIEPRKSVIVVYKFDNIKCVQTFSYETTVFDRSGSLRLPLRCQQMNSYGLYNLGVLFEHTSANADHCKATGVRSATTPSMTLFQINFDTVNETFSNNIQELSGLRRPLWDARNWEPALSGGVVWNDLIYYIQNGTARMGNDASLGWKSRIEIRGVRALCIADGSSTLIVDEDSPWFSEEEGSRSIAVDDDFLVVISDKGYDAWNFGDSGLRDKPWRRSAGPLWRLRLTTQDTDCPVQGCSCPDNNTSCRIFGG